MSARCSAVGGAAPDHLNVLRGVVREMVYQGDSFLLQVQLADGIKINLRGISTSGAMAAIPRPGEAVTLGLSPDDTVLLADEGPRP